VSRANELRVGGGEDVLVVGEWVSSSSSKPSRELTSSLYISPPSSVVAVPESIEHLPVGSVAPETTLLSAVRREARRSRRSSSFCLRISRSSVRFMARREELLISRSRTLRSRRALAASSLRCSSLLLAAGRVGLWGGVAAGAGVVVGRWSGGVGKGEEAAWAADGDRGGSGVGAKVGCAANEGLGVETLDLAEGEMSEKARLFLRFGVVSKAPTLVVFAWFDLRGDGVLRLARLVMFVVRASGASIVLELFETRRVCRLGELKEVFRDGMPPFEDVLVEGIRETVPIIEVSFKEEFLEVISSLRGEAARCWPLEACPGKAAWCGDRRVGSPTASFMGGDIASFELFARKNFGRPSPRGGLVLNDDLLLSSSSRPSCVYPEKTVRKTGRCCSGFDGTRGFTSLARKNIGDPSGLATLDRSSARLD